MPIVWGSYMIAVNGCRIAEYLGLKPSVSEYLADNLYTVFISVFLALSLLLI